MGDAGVARRVDAGGSLRVGSDARRRGDDDPRHLPIARVTLYHAAGCHLCERARGVLVEAAVEFDEVDIGGDAELEARYREWLPVVEVDGERAFVYYVDPDALRRRLAASPPM